MADLVFALIVVAFFGMCAVYLSGCDRMVRDAEENRSQPDPEPSEVAPS